MFVVRRHPENPILSPRREHPWETLATFNPSAVKTDAGVRLYYRALSNPAALVSPYAGQSTIGTAVSEDGVHFHSRRQVLIPEESWDAYGCEDPRATVIGGKTYLCYTALGGFPYHADNIKVGIAISEDGENFKERHLATPFNAKAFSLFPEKVGGKYAALLTAHTDRPPAEVCIAQAEHIEDFWSSNFWNAWYANWHSHALPLKRNDRDHVEAGPAPLLTERGWLIFYSYIENYFGGGPRVFGVEAALLDRDDPSRILGRTYPLLVPEEIYERYGIAPDIVFPTGAIQHDDGLPTGTAGTIDLYYGAADTTCAKATVRTADLLDSLSSSGTPRTLTRARENPILSPSGHAFEHRAVFNAAALDLESSVHILYRAMSDDNTSTIGYAISADGIHVDERLAEPIYVPRAEFEMKRSHPMGNSGCEDPRVVLIGDRIYMTYTAYDGMHAPRGAVSSISKSDFLTRNWNAWSAPVLLTPDDVDDKDVTLLPEAVDNRYILYHRIGGRICADILPDLSFGKRVSRCIEIMGPRDGMWDAAKVGMAGPPIKVASGWLLIYHGVSHRMHYRLGAALLDPSGTTLLSRTADPIFEPVEPYETEGEVKNVVFSCGAVVRGDRFLVYYGGGDKVLGVAEGSLSRILSALS